MSEGMGQYGNEMSASRSLEAAAGEFRRRVEEAAGRLNAAAEQFASMSNGLVSAVEEARQASERAEQSRQAVEAMKEQMARDYGNVSDLVRDLQQRIGALATLAQPMPSVQTQSDAPSVPETQQGESQPSYQESQSSYQESQPGNYGSPGESSW